MARAKVILDSNLYIAYYLTNDSCHGEARFVFDLVNNDDVLDEIRHFLSVPAKLSFTDITLLLLSNKAGAELITFDKQLLKLYKKSNSR